MICGLPDGLRLGTLNLFLLWVYLRTIMVYRTTLVLFIPTRKLPGCVGFKYRIAGTALTVGGLKEATQVPVQIRWCYTTVGASVPEWIWSTYANNLCLPFIASIHKHVTIVCSLLAKARWRCIGHVEAEVLTLTKFILVLLLNMLL
jgi:hypothetical protein